jgi:hypothetical protein
MQRMFTWMPQRKVKAAAAKQEFRPFSMTPGAPASCCCCCCCCCTTVRLGSTRLGTVAPLVRAPGAWLGLNCPRSCPGSSGVMLSGCPNPTSRLPTVLPRVSRVECCGLAGTR